MRAIPKIEFISNVDLNSNSDEPFLEGVWYDLKQKGLDVVHNNINSQDFVDRPTLRVLVGNGFKGKIPQMLKDDKLTPVVSFMLRNGTKKDFSRILNRGSEEELLFGFLGRYDHLLTTEIINRIATLGANNFPQLVGRDRPFVDLSDNGFGYSRVDLEKHGIRATILPTDSPSVRSPIGVHQYFLSNKAKGPNLPISFGSGINVVAPITGTKTVYKGRLEEAWTCQGGIFMPPSHKDARDIDRELYTRDASIFVAQIMANVFPQVRERLEERLG